MGTARLKARTYDFAIRIVKLCRQYPRTLEGRLFSQQLLRAGTSVASNYRAACRGRSHREFIAKIGTVIEEADESEFWLRATHELGIVSCREVDSLRAEADELVAIFTRARQTATRNGQNITGPAAKTVADPS